MIHSPAALEAMIGIQPGGNQTELEPTSISVV